MERNQDSQAPLGPEAWGSRLFEVPSSRSESEQSLVVTLKVLLWTGFFVAALLGLFALLWPEFRPWGWVCVLTLSTNTIALWLTYRGHLQLSSRLFVGVLLMLVLVAVVGSGEGYRSTAFNGGLLATVFAGLLIGWRTAIVIASTHISLLIIVWVVERTGVVLPMVFPHSELMSWATRVVIDLWILVGLGLGLHRLLRSRDMLESRVHERTEQLERARDAAIAASRAKSDFLANMSHEIRTPLNAVIGMTGMLLETKLDTRQRSYTGIVRSSGESLLTLISDILDFSKIEAGELRLERVPVSVHECLNNAVELVALVASSKGIELVAYVDPEVPIAIYSDPMRVQQTLANLLSNAVKFTDRGEIEIRASVHDRHIQISVRDSGVGIAPDALPTLFSAFVQADVSTTRRFGGTGLGLAITKRLVEALGGSIGVQSTPGVGSTFRFTLPAESAPYERPAYLDASTDVAGLRVVVFDDNATNREVLGLQLDSWGMIPILVEDGARAQELVEEVGAFDCVILDMQMPGFDSLQFARALLDRPATSAIPVVMLSSIGGLNSDWQGHDQWALLIKPVRPSKLFNLLHSIATSGSPHSEHSDLVMLDAQIIKGAARVLVVEDNTTNQKVALLSLERLGYRAEVAADGEEAITALTRFAYDIVLMDIHMPVLDGLEATRQIRANPHLRQPYIVAVTANATPEDRTTCMVAGMDDYISKPYRIRDIEKVLVRYTKSPRYADPRPMELSETDRDTSTDSKSFDQEFDRPRNPKVFDREILMQLRSDMSMEDDPAQFGEFVAQCLDDVESHVARAEQARIGSDVEALQGALHNLKSNSALLGANEVASIAERLERDILDGQEEFALQQIGVLRSSLVAFQTELKRDRIRWLA